MRKKSIYIKGYSFKKMGFGGWAALLVDEKSGRKKLIKGYSSRTTGDHMELTAAIRALNAIAPSNIVKVISDNRYLVDKINKWIGKEIDGVESHFDGDLWRELSLATKHCRVKFEWADRLPLIEYVTKIAKEEAKRAKEYTE